MLPRKIQQSKMLASFSLLRKPEQVSVELTWQQVSSQEQKDVTLLFSNLCPATLEKPLQQMSGSEKRSSSMVIFSALRYSKKIHWENTLRKYTAPWRLNSACWVLNSFQAEMGDYVGSGLIPSRTGEKWLNFCQLLSLLSQESLNEIRTWPCMFVCSLHTKYWVLQK